MRLPLIHSAGAAAGQFLDRLLCVAGAVLFSQMPEFMQQYLQRLEGHLDEARLQLDRLREASAQSGATVGQLAANAAASADPMMQRFGAVIAETADRVARLSAADDALRHATALARPFVFLSHLDPSIARAALRIYRPAVPTTFEGLAYACAGMVAMLALYHGCVRYPIQRAWAGRSARRKPEIPPAAP